MREALILLQFINVLVLFVGCVYLFAKWRTRAQSYLFLYCIATLVNSLGYLIEMTAANSEIALQGTQIAYMGKVFIPVSFFLFICNICKVRIHKVVMFILLVVHTSILALVLSCRYNTLFYTSITYTEEGLFPHNVYGHGVAYNLYMIMLIVYFIVSAVVLIKSMIKEKIKEIRRQYFYSLASVVSIIVGFLLFLSGVTKGYDTTAFAYMLCAVFFCIAMFKYKLLDALVMVKDYAIDNLADGIIAVNDVNEVIYYNEPMAKIYPNIAANKQEIVTRLDELISEKESVYRDKAIYRPSVKPLYQGEIYRGNMYVLTDMTENMTYTLELKKQKEIAEKANNSKSAFLSNMSHEIRTPMNAIVGMTEILLRKGFDEETEEYLENIRYSGNALLSIINDILDFSKIESGKMEIVEDDYDLRNLLKELDIVFTTRIGKKPVKMIYDIDEQIPEGLSGDEKRIRQVLINLVNNAIKFTEEGFVRVAATVDRKEDDKVYITFCVQDTGQGIKKEDLGKLFGSYQQVDTKKNHKKEGTGLGLAICRQLIKLMKGNIQVESVYGEGSKFFFTIPQGVLDHAIVKEDNQSQDEFEAPDAKVLVVDDSEMNLKVFKGLFEPIHMQIETAENGKEAVELLKTNDYDIIFMDHMMPIMDGIEATLTIRNMCGDYFHRKEYYENIPIIALSANATEEAKELFMNSKMNGFVSKPMKTKQVLSVLRQWLPKEKIIEKATEESGKNEALESTDTSVKNDVPENVNVQNADVQSKKIEGIDMEEGIMNCGSENLHRSLMSDFFKLIDQKTAKVKQCLEEGAIKDFTIEVHALKSSARMIGAKKLSEEFYDLEKLGNAGDVETITKKTPSVLEFFNSYKDILKPFAKEEIKDKKNVSNGQIKEILMVMRDAVNEFDLDGIDNGMKELEGYEIPKELEEMMEQLSSYVADVSMEEILKLSGDMIDLL
ncbi:MAG: histidine kinase N-terminal 7TM domain-containing protein [Lachnospira sp.]